MFDEDSPYDDIFIQQKDFHQSISNSQSDARSISSRPKLGLGSSFLQKTSRCHGSENSTFHVTPTTCNTIKTDSIDSTTSSSDRLSLDCGSYALYENSQATRVATNTGPRQHGRLSSLSFNTFNHRASSISNCSYNSRATLDSSTIEQQPQSFTNMIAKLASNTSGPATLKPTSGQLMASATLQASNSVPMSSSQSKRKRSKLLDLLLNTNWSKQSQQASHLMKLNKVLLFCDANFLDEKTGESPLSLAITSPQINELQASTAKSSRLRLIGSNNSHTMNSTSVTCPKSTSLFDLQNQHSTTCHSQLTLRQTSSVEISQSKAPLVERILLLLIKSGAVIDFRNSDGRTPLHVAAMKSNFWALKTLLDLGASTDSLDTNGLTPLFLSVLHKAELKVTQLLLNHINSSTASDANVQQMTAITNGDIKVASTIMGISDQHGWQAIHYAAKYGLSGHIEKLLYYGCDINARITGSGNTPLHVAAINDQLQVAQTLLLRGANRAITNNSHQNAHQVAVISNNMDLAEFIASHDETKVIPFKDWSHSLASGHSSEQAARTANNSNRSSISSAQQFLVKSDSSAIKLSNNSASSYHNSGAPRTGIVQPQLQEQQTRQQLQPDHHQLKALSLDVTNHYAGSLSSSAPTTNASGTSHQTARSSLLSIDTSSVQHNHQLNVQVNNISPCLSQRSCATSNTTTTSSSGVCCDGDGHNSEDQSTRPDGRSNVTIISIANNSAAEYNDEIQYDHRHATNKNEIVATLENRGNKSQQPYQSGSTIQANGHSSEFGANESSHGTKDEVNDQSDSESCSSSDGLYSLMSEKKPLFVGSMVRATNCYESGDPRHLQLRREDLVEILEFPPDLIQDGQLPRLANKPMLYGRRQSDGMCGLFPSFCVRLSKHKFTVPRRPMQDATNFPGHKKHQPQQLQQSPMTSTNEQSICGFKLAESQKTSPIGVATKSQQYSSATLDSNRRLESSTVRFREFKVTLDKIDGGFGFVLRGARIDPATFSPQSRGEMAARISIDENLMAANKLASLQYFSDIEPNSIAHQSGLKRGDFLVSVNDHDVRLCSHEQVVHMVRQSGDRVQLTIARTESDTCAKTLTRVKPEPPKRDPSTTLTRDRASRIKSMFVAPQQQQQLLMWQSGTFDADKPLPDTPSLVSYPVGLNRSMSTNLSQFSSANSLSSVAPDSQSVTSISTVDSGQAAPTSSSSTATLTTVATTKPKTAPKPSDILSKTRPTSSDTANQANLQSAAVITTNKWQPQDRTVQSCSQAYNRPSEPISGASKTPSASQIETAPPPPPPPPPPMPDFLGTAGNGHLIKRRTSAPTNVSSPLMRIDRNQLLKKRESLACVSNDLGSKSNTTAAPICTVAAACAAAANNRLQRQQQQQHQQVIEQDEGSSGFKESSQLDTKSLEVNANDTLVEVATKDASSDNDLQAKSPKESTIEKTVAESNNTRSGEKSKKFNGLPAGEHRRHNNHLVTQSATLGRKSSAQIIQQPKQNSNPSHSQTLKIVTTKRMSILDHNMFPHPSPPTLPPPPMFAEHPKAEHEIHEQRLLMQQQQRQQQHQMDQHLHQRHNFQHQQAVAEQQRGGPLPDRHLMDQMYIQTQQQMLLRQQQCLRQQQQMQERMRQTVQQQQQQQQHQQHRHQCLHHHHRVNVTHSTPIAQTLNRSDLSTTQLCMHTHQNHNACQHQSKYINDVSTMSALVQQQRHQQYHDRQQILPNHHYSGSHQHQHRHLSGHARSAGLHACGPAGSATRADTLAQQQREAWQ